VECNLLKQCSAMQCQQPADNDVSLRDEGAAGIVNLETLAAMSL
jgi:hypothetical protein